VEPFGKALGASTKDLTLPIIRMMEAKRLKTKGQQRRTRCFAGGVTTTAGPARKASALRQAGGEVAWGDVGHGCSKVRAITANTARHGR